VFTDVPPPPHFKLNGRSLTCLSLQIGQWYLVCRCIIMRGCVVLWLGCRCCCPSVNTICGRIMIGSLLLFVSKHNMGIRPHIVFTDGRQPNHNTTTYCVYWRTPTPPLQVEWSFPNLFVSSDRSMIFGM
jgi:hypothetical protein